MRLLFLLLVLLSGALQAQDTVTVTTIIPPPVTIWSGQKHHTILGQTAAKHYLTDNQIVSDLLYGRALVTDDSLRREIARQEMGRVTVTSQPLEVSGTGTAEDRYTTSTIPNSDYGYTYDRRQVSMLQVVESRIDNTEFKEAYTQIVIPTPIHSFTGSGTVDDPFIIKANYRIIGDSASMEKYAASQKNARNLPFPLPELIVFAEKVAPTDPDITSMLYSIAGAIAGGEETRKEMLEAITTVTKASLKKQLEQQSGN